MARGPACEVTSEQSSEGDFRVQNLLCRRSRSVWAGRWVGRIQEGERGLVGAGLIWLQLQPLRSVGGGSATWAEVRA